MRIKATGRGGFFAFKFGVGGVPGVLLCFLLWILSSTQTVGSVWDGSKAKELAKVPREERGSHGRGANSLVPIDFTQTSCSPVPTGPCL